MAKIKNHHRHTVKRRHKIHHYNSRLRLYLKVKTVIPAILLLTIVLGSLFFFTKADDNTPLQRASAGVTLYFQQINDTAQWQQNSYPLIGKPRLVITRHQGTDADEQFAVKKIHETGGLAYRYLQYFWMPDNNADPDNGIKITDHPDWIYCKQGDTPLLGRNVNGVKSYFLDLNEKAVDDNMKAFYKKVKDVWGYDGVFVDIGRGARSGRKDFPEAKQLNPAQPSTCTQNPVIPGRSFGNAYMQTLTNAKAAGLKTILNYDRAYVPGKMLPSSWYQYLDWTLDESTNDDDIRQTWYDIFNVNRAAEIQGQGKTIQLIKEFIKDANGKPTTNKNDIYFRSARAKLFSSPIAINSLDPRLYPELASATLNGPFAQGPQAITCTNLATGECLWYRRYSGGFVIVNNTKQNLSTKNVKINTQTCRFIKNLYSGQMLKDGICLNSIDMSIPAKSGRILQYNAIP